MRKRSHRPSKGMTGRPSGPKKAQKEPQHREAAQQLSRDEAERDKAMYNRLADFEIVMDPRTDWFGNTLAMPANSETENPKRREAIEAARRICRSRGEFCRSCALPIRWKTDLASDKRAKMTSELKSLSKALIKDAEASDPDNVDNPDRAAGRILEQIVKGWEEGEYCGCYRQSGPRSATG